MSEHLTKEEIFKIYIKEIDQDNSIDSFRHLQKCDECRSILLDYETLEKNYLSQDFLKPNAKTVSQIKNFAKRSTGGKFDQWFWFLPRWVLNFLVILIVVSIILTIKFTSKEEIAVVKEELDPASEIIGPDEDFIEEPDFENATDVENEAIENPDDFDNEFIDADEENKWDKLLERGLHFQSLEQYHIATKIYRKILRKNKNYEKRNEVLLNWAYCLENLERYHEALLQLKRILRVDPDHEEAKIAFERVENIIQQK
jgi:tetratricopeptide (TPR) repeat protein